MIHTRSDRDFLPSTADSYNDEEDLMPTRYAEAADPDREISLGTGTILAIFFALALVCSVFFGFGYTIGHRSVGPAVIAAAGSQGRPSPDAFTSFKPAPGSLGVAPAAKSPLPGEDEARVPPSNAVVVTAPAAHALKPAANDLLPQKPFDPDAEIVTSAAPATNVRPQDPTRSQSTIRASSDDKSGVIPTVQSGTFVVQVAAVSHQEDADTLVAALKRRGYTVAVHHEPQDKLLHIQLGPYSAKKDAEAMRQRLQADNYNAILK